MRRIAVVLTVWAACLVLPLSPASAEEDGKALYDKKCALCHGKDGVAKKMAEGSGNFNDPAWQEKISTEDIVKVTVEGKGKMKSYKEKLTAEQIAMIAKYIKTLK